MFLPKKMKMFLPKKIVLLSKEINLLPILQITFKNEGSRHGVTGKRIFTDHWV
jgi:hypothetical protein